MSTELLKEEIVLNPKALNVKLDYYKGKRKSEDPKEQSLTANYIQFAVDSKHKDGLKLRDRKIYSRIQDKLDEAVEQDLSIVVFEQAEIDFLKDAFKDSKFPAILSRQTVMLETAIEQLGK